MELPTDYPEQSGLQDQEGIALGFPGKIEWEFLDGTGVRSYEKHCRRFFDNSFKHSSKNTIRYPSWCSLGNVYIFFFFLGKPVFTSGITSLVPSGIPMKDVSEILRECLQKYLSRFHGIHSLPDGSDGRVSIVSIFGEIRSLPLKIPQGSFSEDPSSLLKFLSGALSWKFFSLRIVFFIP